MCLGCGGKGCGREGTEGVWPKGVWPKGVWPRGLGGGGGQKILNDMLYIKMAEILNVVH